MSHSPMSNDPNPKQRSLHLIGRSRELAWVEDWLRSPRPETRVLFLTGMGGIGKSTLLRHMAETARAADASVAVVDLEMIGLSAPAVLDALKRQVEFPPGQGPEGERRLFIGIDHYDDVGSLDDWLRSEVLPQCPSEGCLVVIASRRGAPYTWGDDPVGSSRLMRFPLSLLSAAEARELLGRIGTAQDLSDVETERLIRESQGLPLALVVNAHSPTAEVGGGRAPMRIASRLFREVSDPSLEAVTEALTVLHHADQELLSACLAQPVSPDLYRRASGLSMIITSEGGLRLHSVVREHLFKDLTLRAPHRRHRLTTRALTALGARLNDPLSSPDLRRLDGLNLLFLCRDAIGQIFSADQAEEPEYSVEALDRKEMPILHQLLEDAAVRLNHFRSTGQLHQLLDVVAEHLPGSIAVFKTSDGETAAFSAVVPLHRESVPLLSQFPVIASYLDSCSPEQHQAMDVPPSRADTFFLTGGFDAGTPEQTPLVESPPTLSPPAWPQALRHAMSVLAPGGRLIGLTTDPGALQHSNELGFHALDVRCDSCDTSKPLYYIELDLRQGRFTPWALAFMRAYLTQAGEANAADSEDETIRELAARLRQALRGLQHPGRVDRETAARLHRLLTEQPAPAPLTSEMQGVLRLTFLEKGKQNKKAFAIAGELNISRPTYFRRLNEALLALATVWSGEAKD